jgi:hypothetical protein
LPEEVHLRAGGEQGLAMYLRCVGKGDAKGSLRFVAPKGIRIEPETVAIGPLSEGEEKVVRLKVKAETEAANALRHIRIEPVDKTPAAANKLTVSVGVVLTEDKRVPAVGQSIIRAPGYTMKIDQFSGVSYYLLDADGQRRHGRIHNTNFCFGIPALAAGDQWVFRYRYPCQFVWDGKNTLTIGPGNGERVRLKYTFQQDQIVIALLLHPPSDPKREYVLWLGNFDVLSPARSLGSQKLAGDAVERNWYFFPHPRYRQGVLLGLPEQTKLLRGQGGGTSVSVTMRATQQVVLRFASEEELKKLME